MEAAVDHFERCLSATTPPAEHYSPISGVNSDHESSSAAATSAAASDPLSFIVFVPDWRDPTPPVITRLESSRFKRRQLTIPANEHQLRHGFYHAMETGSRDLLFKSPHALLVVFLQNDAAAAKWGPTQERCDALIDSFRMGRDINPLSVPLTPTTPTSAPALTSVGGAGSMGPPLSAPSVSKSVSNSFGLPKLSTTRLHPQQHQQQPPPSQQPQQQQHSSYAAYAASSSSIIHSPPGGGTSGMIS